jgi:hypothetical protein
MKKKKILNEEKEKGKVKSKKRRREKLWVRPHGEVRDPRSQSVAAPVAPGDRLLNWFCGSLI